MSKIVDFSAADFIEKESEYCQMLNQIKSRVIEIAQDFGKIEKNECWTVSNVDLYEEDDNEFWIHVALFQYDKNINFDFNASWLFSDDYKDLAQKSFAKRQAEKDTIEYEEYLRLKEKFEGKRVAANE